MPPGTTVPMSPVPGAEIPLSKVPSGVSIVEGQDFARQGYIDSAQEVLQQRVPGVIIGDAQGNVFQTNVQFRGFEASPVNGVPQGLAVYQDGVRINESFGDIVNWDFLPEVAIGNVTILSNNPVYGLNALGGAVVVNMKNGFDYHGAEITASGGSFGRAQGTAEVGMQSGNVSLYGAASVSRMMAIETFRGPRSGACMATWGSEIRTSRFTSISPRQTTSSALPRQRPCSFLGLGGIGRSVHRRPRRTKWSCPP